MQEHGNLYWEIKFSGLFDGAEDCYANEDADVTVSSYDFATAYRRAEVMYNALLKLHPDRVYCGQAYLRDDSSVSPSAPHHIYAYHHIASEKMNAFFSVGSDKCLRLTLRA
jgi:hypothetical protein